MGVSEVPGYGPITSGNAKEIYLAWRNGNVDLEVSQQKYCESFLSPSDWDEIEYDSGNNKKEGYEQISDADKAKEHSDSGANAAGTSAGMAAGAVGVCALAKVASGLTDKNGFVALGMGAAVAVSAIITNLFANAFDNAYSDRCDTNARSDDTNAIIDEQNNMLVESMDMMNEDMANYDAQSQEYMVTVNSTNAELADLQVQLADAEAAGDTQGAAAIRAQIKALQNQGYEGDEEELQGMRDGLLNYSALGDESRGVADAGDTVGEFLRDGKWLGPIAAVDTALLTAATIFSTKNIYNCAIAAAKAAAKLAAGIAEAIAAGVGAVLFTAATVILGKATYTMGDKTKKEFECGAAGDEMGDKVSALNDMIEQQGGYIDETEGFYGEADAARAEDNAEGETMANKNSFDNDGGDIHSDPYAQSQGEGKTAA